MIIDSAYEFREWNRFRHRKEGETGGKRSINLANLLAKGAVCGSNRVRGEMRGGWPRSFIKKLFGGDGKLGWMKIAEEARDHLSGRNEVSSVPLKFWSCWDTFGAEERKQEGRNRRANMWPTRELETNR